MRKVTFCIFISLLIPYSVCAEDAPNMTFEKKHVEVSADTLVQLLNSGYEIKLDSCTILGRFTYHRRIQQILEITNSTFKGVVNFVNIIIEKKLIFNGSTFLDTVTFSGARFGGYGQSNGEISFTGATFVGIASFPYLTINIPTYINSVTFEEFVGFQYTKFDAYTSFIGTTFKGYADFKSSIMTELSEFDHAIFKAEIDNRGRPYSGSFDSSILIKTSFINADLSNVMMDPDTISQFSMSSLAFAEGLRELKFYRPEMMSKIKSHFRQNNYRQPEREITCALKRHDQNFIEKIAFDYTSEYGSKFIRPIQILVGLWLTCSIIYLFLFRFSRKSRLMTTTTTFGYTGQRHVESKSTESYSSNKLFRVRNIRYAFFFSLLSTFNIGFRDFNFSRLVRLLLPQEMDFRPTGVLRTISAIQAIFSVFLIGLWILSYFGRPFD